MTVVADLGAARDLAGHGELGVGDWAAVGSPCSQEAARHHAPGESPARLRAAPDVATSADCHNVLRQDALGSGAVRHAGVVLHHAAAVLHHAAAVLHHAAAVLHHARRCGRGYVAPRVRRTARSGRAEPPAESSTAPGHGVRSPRRNKNRRRPSHRTR